MTTNTETPDETQDKSDNRPDWVAKTPKGYGRKQHLERVGAAWNRKDGGICLRLMGTQIVAEDIYLYPAEQVTEAGA